MSDIAPKKIYKNKVIDNPRATQAMDIQPLPASIDAEKAVLGALILDAEQIENVMAILKPHYFFHRRHELLYKVILEMYDKGIAIDFTTLAAEMKRRGYLEEVGGPGYILGLEQHVFSTVNAPDHARIVLQKSQLRELIHISDTIKEDALSEKEDVDLLLDTAEKMIFDLSEQHLTREFQDISTVTLEVLDEIDRRASVAHETSGTPTGFEELDNWTGGFQPSDLIILAARPSIGKTAFALNIALNAGAGLRGKQLHPDKQRGVGIFSLEMSASQVNMRILSSLSGVPMHLMRQGKLNSKHRTTLHKYARELHGAPIYIDDTPGISVLELRAKARRLMARQPNLGMIVIDYLQLMRGSGLRSGESRQQEVSEISRSLKALARELNVPVVALSQLSRGIEQRKGKNARPMLSDLRESGAIEQDADMVMFLHREKNFDKKDGDDDGGSNADINVETAELVIGKQRNGPIGIIDLIFFRETATYKCVTKFHGNEDGPDF